MKNIKSNSNRIDGGVKDQLVCYLMIVPFAAMFMLFLVLPIITSFFLSFFEFDMVSIPKFIGFSNYFRILFDDEVFMTTLKNTLLFAVITGPAGFILSFVLAWFLNEFRPIIRTILSFMFYCPALVGNAYYIWQVAFSSDSYGYINSMLISMGFITEPIYWLKDANYVMPIIIIVQLWMSMGVSFLANISGLQNVNGEMYEAGAIDGIRNRWQELWYITLPSMQHILLFSAVMQIASAFSVSQLPIALAGYPSVSNSVDTIVSYLADAGTVRYEMGYASAISVFLFGIMMVTRIVIGKLINKVGS
jgi:multiple sugar transport system permease protein